MSRKLRPAPRDVADRRDTQDYLDDVYRMLTEDDSLAPGQISGFDEKVDDRVADLIQDSDTVTWTYDDAAGTLTAEASGNRRMDTLYVDHILENSEGHGVDLETVHFEDGNIKLPSDDNWVGRGAADLRTYWIDATGVVSTFGAEAGQRIHSEDDDDRYTELFRYGASQEAERINQIEVDQADKCISFGTDVQHVNSFIAPGAFQAAGKVVFTIEFWAKPNAGSNMAVFGAVWGTDRFYFWIDSAGSTSWSGGVGHSGWGNTSVSVDVGSWQHIAYVTDVSLGRVIIYKNGVAVGNPAYDTNPANLPVITPGVDGSNCWIGDYNNGLAAGHAYYSGLIDELRVYNRALSAAEITAHYNSGSGLHGEAGDDSQLGAWHFNEGDGVYALDYENDQACNLYGDDNAAAWSGTTAYGTTERVIPTTFSKHLYGCIKPGTSGGGEPTWPTVTGETVADNDVIWMALNPNFDSAWVTGHVGVETGSAPARIWDSISSSSQSYLSETTLGDDMTDMIWKAKRLTITVGIDDYMVLDADEAIIYKRTLFSGDTLRVYDADSSHTMGFVSGEDLSADRNLVLILGDATRSLELEADAILDQDYTTDADVRFATLSVNNSGIHIYDTGGDHDMILASGEDLTADRTLTFVLVDGNRQLTIEADSILDQDYSSDAVVTFQDLILQDFASGNETIDEILDDIIHGDVLDAIIVTAGVGLNISWSAGEIWNHTAKDVVDTDANAGPVGLTDHSINYLYYDRSGGGTALTASTTVPDLTDDDVFVAQINCAGGDIREVNEVPVYSEQIPTLIGAFRNIFPSIVTDGLIVSEHAGGAAFDVNMTEGTYYLAAYGEENIGAQDSTVDDMINWWQSAAGEHTAVTAQNELDNTQWNTGNALVGINNAKWYRSLFFADDDGINWMYPTAEYNTRAAAIAGPDPIKPYGLQDHPSVMALVLRGNAAALPASGDEQWIDRRPILGGIGGGSVVSHTGLADLNWAAAGHNMDTNLDMVNNEIENVSIITVANSGIHILDTGGDHDLILASGEDLTGDETLTVTLGDASRTLTFEDNAIVSQDYSVDALPQFAGITIVDNTANAFELKEAGISYMIVNTTDGLEQFEYCTDKYIVAKGGSDEALNAAIDTLPAGGGQVKVMAGNSSINAITFYDVANTAVVGCGHSTVWTSTISSGHGIEMDQTSSTLRDIRWTGPNSGTGSGAYLNGVNYGEISGCYFDECGRDGIILNAAGFASVFNNVCEGNNRYGIRMLGGSSLCAVSFNRCHDNATWGFYVTGANNVAMVNNTAQDNGGASTGNFYCGAGSSTYVGNTSVQGSASGFGFNVVGNNNTLTANTVRRAAVAFSCDGDFNVIGLSTIELSSSHATQIPAGEMDNTFIGISYHDTANGKYQLYLIGANDRTGIVCNHFHSTAALAEYAVFAVNSDDGLATGNIATVHGTGSMIYDADCSGWVIGWNQLNQKPTLTGAANITNIMQWEDPSAMLIDGNYAQSWTVADGGRDNAYVGLFYNQESDNDRSFGVYIAAGCTAVDYNIRGYDHDEGNELWHVDGSGAAMFLVSVSTDDFIASLGAVGTPSHTFTGDLDTGMWSSGADILNFSVGGIEAIEIEADGDVVFNHNVGIGVTPTAGYHVHVENITIDTTTSYKGILNNQIKTLGATDAADELTGGHNAMELDQVGGTVGLIYGMRNSATLRNGTATTLYGSFEQGVMKAGTVGSVFGIRADANIDGGAITGSIYGSWSRVDIEAAVTSIAGDVYGHHIWVDADKNPTGAVHMLYLDEATGVDYGIYQNGTAPWKVGGDVVIDAGKSFDAYTNAGHLKPRRVSQAAQPTPEVGELLAWHDTDDGKTYLVYEDPTVGTRQVEMV